MRRMEQLRLSVNSNRSLRVLLASSLLTLSHTDPSCGYKDGVWRLASVLNLGYVNSRGWDEPGVSLWRAAEESVYNPVALPYTETAVVTLYVSHSTHQMHIPKSLSPG